MKKEFQFTDHLIPLNYRKSHADHLQSPTTLDNYTDNYDDRNHNTRKDGEPAIRINKKLKFATKEKEYAELNARIFSHHIRNKYHKDRETQVLFFQIHELIIQPKILDYINWTPLQIEIFILNLNK